MESMQESKRKRANAQCYRQIHKNQNFLINGQQFALTSNPILNRTRMYRKQTFDKLLLLKFPECGEKISIEHTCFRDLSSLRLCHSRRHVEFTIFDHFGCASCTMILPLQTNCNEYVHEKMVDKSGLRNEREIVCPYDYAVLLILLLLMLLSTVFAFDMLANIVWELRRQTFYWIHTNTASTKRKDHGRRVGCDTIIKPTVKIYTRTSVWHRKNAHFCEVEKHIPSWDSQQTLKQRCHPIHTRRTSERSKSGSRIAGSNHKYILLIFQAENVSQTNCWLRDLKHLIWKIRQISLFKFNLLEIPRLNSFHLANSPHKISNAIVLLFGRLFVSCGLFVSVLFFVFIFLRPIFCWFPFWFNVFFSLSIPQLLYFKGILWFSFTSCRALFRFSLFRCFHSCSCSF